MSEIQTINTQVRPVLPHDMESAWRMAKAIAASGLAPKGIQTTEAIFTAMQMGAEVGLSPMQALQNIAVVNGRPTIWGDAQLGLVRGSGLLESFEERIEGEGDKRTAYCIVKRKGDPVAITGKFSVEEAKTAQLWGKTGPWTQYPERMLKMRARGFALRDGFSDILKGLYSYEEAVGMQDVTPTRKNTSVSSLNDEFLTPKVIDEPVSAEAENAPTIEQSSIVQPAEPFVAQDISVHMGEWNLFVDDFYKAAETATTKAHLAQLKSKNGTKIKNCENNAPDEYKRLIDFLADREKVLTA